LNSIHSLNYSNLLNFILFQVVWFVCVIYQNPGLYLAIPCILVLLLTSSLAHGSLLADIKLIILLSLLALLIDGTLISTGVFILSSSAQPAYWLLVIWIGFSLTLNHSLKPIVKQPVIATISGAIFGPLAYHAGMVLGAIQFGLPAYYIYPLLAIIWCLLMWLFSHLAKQNQSLVQKRNRKSK